MMNFYVALSILLQQDPLLTFLFTIRTAISCSPISHCCKSPDHLTLFPSFYISVVWVTKPTAITSRFNSGHKTRPQTCVCFYWSNLAWLKGTAAISLSSVCLFSRRQRPMASCSWGKKAAILMSDRLTDCSIWAQKGSGQAWLTAA